MHCDLCAAAKVWFKLKKCSIKRQREEQDPDTESHRSVHRRLILCDPLHNPPVNHLFLMCMSNPLNYSNSPWQQHQWMSFIESKWYKEWKSLIMVRFFSPFKIICLAAFFLYAFSNSPLLFPTKSHLRTSWGPLIYCTLSTLIETIHIDSSLKLCTKIPVYILYFCCCLVSTKEKIKLQKNLPSKTRWTSAKTCKSSHDPNRDTNQH